MHGDHIGHLFALLAAINWAFALVLFKRSGEHVSPLSLNIFKNTVGIVLLVATLAATGQGWQVLRSYPVEDVAILVLSGVLGIALADTIQFIALNAVGVGTISVIDCTYSPIAVMLGWLMLGEKLSVGDWSGIVLIVAGVLLAADRRAAGTQSTRQTALGVLAGVGAIALMVVSIVFAKPVLTVDRFPLVWATLLRLSVGTVVLAVMAVASPDRRQVWSCFRPTRVWWYSVSGSVLGAYLAMLFWVGGFKYARVSEAAILNQTSVIFAIILATVVLKEPFGRRRLLAVCSAFSGAALVTLA